MENNTSIKKISFQPDENEETEKEEVPNPFDVNESNTPPTFVFGNKSVSEDQEKNKKASIPLQEEEKEEEIQEPDLEETVSDSISGTERLKDICDVLFSKEPGLLVLHIQEPLRGEIDLSFLGKSRRLEEIQFAEGTDDRMITRLSGFPQSVRKITCTKNRLKEIADLPNTLEELNVMGNQLTTIDFSQTPLLRVFRGSNNQFVQFDTFPASLEEIYVDNNRLSELDLLGLDRLRVLHCTGNNHPLILKHFPNHPKQPIDLKMDDSPLSDVMVNEDDASDLGESPKKSNTKITYQEALNQYMMYKTKYEASAKNMRVKQQTASKKPSKQPLPPCIHCHAKVGMTFEKKDNVYYARCGSKGRNPNCNFEIELKAGLYISFMDYFKEEMKVFEKDKQDLIQQKMETLFGYIPETDSAELFKQRLEKYVDSSEFVKVLTTKYTELYSNTRRKELIERQQHAISEIKERIQVIMNDYRSDPLNRELLHDAMEIHVNELVPEVEKLRKLKYAIMEMMHVYDKDGVLKTSTLFQSDNFLEKMDYEYESPEVVKYVV